MSRNIKFALIAIVLLFVAAYVVPAIIKAMCWCFLCLFDFANILGDKLALLF